MDILEAIKERRSVRNFDGEGLSETSRKILLNIVEHSTSPFGGSVTIRLKKFDIKDGYKPSTYGMIKGATDFFMLGIGDDEASSLTAGFRFEQVVLKAWQLGLGTCWIAATFKGSTFEDENIWPDGEKLRVICPVGTPAKQSLMEKVTRLSLGSKKRRPFAELFYDWDFEHPLSPKKRFGLALEMMRLAPSSTNSQPWRAVVADDTVHFYYKPQSKSSVLDCGIGICHFYETEKYQSHNGKFFKATYPPVSHESWKYLYSYKSNS
ncbi:MULTISPECIES: nitroreductase family protein [Bacteroidales]|jgi:nitroreductase|uniref:nitroreductase family protein n=1 Tax=Bacteroidales TaxID=171549 RepID=UPI00259AD3E0|nr:MULTISPECIES: nitroreductase family protein [Bacteroidales]